MNKETPRLPIEEPFKHPKSRLHGGAILISSEPLDLETVVRAAYWKWMKWADDRFDIDWYAMAEEIQARTADPILYPLKLLQGFAGESAGDEVTWLEKHMNKNGSLSDRAKPAVFNAHFKISYGPY